jgi:hypothetical protein
MKFWLAISLEFLQNVPLLTAFVTTVWLWRQEHRRWALGCAAIGGTVSALLIRFTEPMLNHIVEPPLVTVTNGMIFSLGMVPFAIYLAAGDRSRWSNWKSDVALGWGIGILLGVSQTLAAGEFQILALLVHIVAMALPVPLILMSVRLLLKGAESLSSVLVRATLLTVAVTVIISLVDYSYMLFL